MTSKQQIEHIDEDIRRVDWDARSPIKERIKMIQAGWEYLIKEHEDRCKKKSHTKCILIEGDDPEAQEYIRLERQYTNMILEHIRLDREKRALLGVTEEEDWALRSVENRLIQNCKNPDLMSSKHDRDSN